MGGFIIGFDSDTENIFDMQIDFLQKAGIPIAMVGLLVVMPNTQLYRRLQKENRIIGNGWHTFNNIDLCLNFNPRYAGAYSHRRIQTCYFRNIQPAEMV